MKSIIETINESMIGNLNGLSDNAKYAVRKVMDVLQIINSTKYNDWQKVSMESEMVGHKAVTQIYYDGKYVDAFDASLMPDDADVIDELGWRHYSED